MSLNQKHYTTPICALPSIYILYVMIIMFLFIIVLVFIAAVFIINGLRKIDTMKGFENTKDNSNGCSSNKDHIKEFNLIIENKTLYERCLDISYKLNSDKIGLLCPKEDIIKLADELFYNIQKIESNNLGRK